MRLGLSVELWLSTRLAELSPCTFSGVISSVMPTSLHSPSKLGGSGSSQSSVFAGLGGNLALCGLIQMIQSDDEGFSIMRLIIVKLLYAANSKKTYKRWIIVFKGYNLLPFLFQIQVIIKSMKRSGRSKGKTEKKDVSKELNQYYLKEILRNIQNIQTTILKKLKASHAYEEHCQNDVEKTVPQTPNRRQGKIRSEAYGKREANVYHSLQTTPKRPKKISCKEGKAEHFTSFTNPEEVKHQALKKISQNQNNFLNKATSHFATNRQQVSLLKTREEKQKNQGQFNTVRLKETTPSNKQNHYISLSKTERAIDRKQQSQRGQSNERAPVTQLTQTTRNIAVCPQNEIQRFYKMEIQKMQLDQHIRQLQEQLQRCLTSKKAANLCEFQFLRSKMKRISVEINELKEKRHQLFITTT